MKVEDFESVPYRLLILFTIGETRLKRTKIIKSDFISGFSFLLYLPPSVSYMQTNCISTPTFTFVYIPSIYNQGSLH